jgi:hypothetical protein
MTAIGELRLPPLREASPEYDDPTRWCALCHDSGWEQCYELATWRRKGGTKREFITQAQYEAFQTQVEGVLRREVYTTRRPCRCSAGDKFRETYKAAQGNHIEAVPVKPVHSEKARRVDGKAKASGE